MSIGPIQKKDVIKASIMLQKKSPEYATILGFDVPVASDVREFAESSGVRIFTADIIYHLEDQFTRYLDEVRGGAALSVSGMKLRSRPALTSTR